MKRVLPLLAVVAVFFSCLGPAAIVGATTTTLSGSAGLEGTVKGNPPTQTPTISVPGNGQNFSNLPITVAGLCQSGTLVEVFKNNVFAGSRECSGSSYSIQIDLFSGRNDLTAQDYDDLNQASPVSNTVTVNFNNALPTTESLITLTTQYAKRGADPNTDLTWPISLSGGTGPYAISIDWGDSSSSDLKSQQFPGAITLDHTYKNAGTYNVTIKATDSQGFSAFLQVVAVANGPIQQSSSGKGSNGAVINETRFVPWWVIGALAALTFIAFWLGMQHRLQVIRARLRAGKPPFG